MWCEQNFREAGLVNDDAALFPPIYSFYSSLDRGRQTAHKRLSHQFSDGLIDEDLKITAVSCKHTIFLPHRYHASSEKFLARTTRLNSAEEDHISHMSDNSDIEVWEPTCVKEEKNWIWTGFVINTVALMSIVCCMNSVTQYPIQTGSRSLNPLRFGHLYKICVWGKKSTMVSYCHIFGRFKYLDSSMSSILTSDQKINWSIYW